MDKRPIQLTWTDGQHDNLERKVSCVNLGSQRLEESLLKGVVKNLTSNNQDFLQQLDEDHVLERGLWSG